MLWLLHTDRCLQLCIIANQHSDARVKMNGLRAALASECCCKLDLSRLEGKMSNLTRLFTIGQIVQCRMDKKFYKGIVKETYPDHIVVDIPEISEHCWFENDFNMDCVYPECNFQE